jgi:hypothetical protein
MMENTIIDGQDVNNGAQKLCNLIGGMFDLGHVASPFRINLPVVSMTSS